MITPHDYKEYVLFLLDKRLNEINKNFFAQQRQEIREIGNLDFFVRVHKILDDPNFEINEGNTIIGNEYHYIGQIYTSLYTLPEKEIKYYSLAVDMGNMKGIDRLIEVCKMTNNVELEEKYLLIKYNIIARKYENGEDVGSYYYSNQIYNLIEFYRRTQNNTKVCEYVTKMIENNISDPSESKQGVRSYNFEYKKEITEGNTDIILKTITAHKRYDVLKRYNVSCSYNMVYNMESSYGSYEEIKREHCHICPLISLLDAYTDEDMLKLIYSIKPEDINEHPKFIQIIHKLLHSNIDPMRLHFEYSMQGKGFEDAQADYYKYLSNRQSNPQ